jgi:hypothetical protein
VGVKGGRRGGVGSLISRYTEVYLQAGLDCKGLERSIWVMMSMNGICDGWDLTMVCCNHNAFDGYRSWHKYILRFPATPLRKTSRVQVVASSPTTATQRMAHWASSLRHHATNSIRLPFNNSSNKKQIKHSTSPPIHLTYPPPPCLSQSCRFFCVVKLARAHCIIELRSQSCRDTPYV